MPLNTDIRELLWAYNNPMRSSQTPSRCVCDCPSPTDPQPCVLRADVPHVYHICKHPDCYCHSHARFHMEHMRHPTPEARHEQ